MKDNMDAGPHVREWMGEYVCMMHLRNQKNIIIFFLISSLWMLGLLGISTYSFAILILILEAHLLFLNLLNKH